MIESVRWEYEREYDMGICDKNTRECERWEFVMGICVGNTRETTRKYEMGIYVENIR